MIAPSSKPPNDVGSTATSIGPDLEGHPSSLLQPSCVLIEEPLPKRVSTQMFVTPETEL